ncbi:Group 10 secretory phospholipase A2 [Tupaia chinensis]|uniref:Phospholipase A2 n=1 Tax=Tupaia chinensis TaxID=246437 RepID=L9KXZ2_TUPCH|nr:Group 10 secretory phospholipase A2 [Tupaia chinensis]
MQPLPGSALPLGKTSHTCFRPVALLSLCLVLALLLLLLLLSPGPGPSVASRKSHVRRRGVLDLAKVVTCVGPRSPFAYIKYGCFCGLGGYGQPRDDIDWCCHRHDCCYTRAEEAGCRPKIDSYAWQCVNQTILCGPTGNTCEELLCKCDQELAYCFAQAKYNIKFLFYLQFLCEENSPKCD